MIRPNDPKWIGEKFNSLTVVGAVHNGRRWLWECSCDCGGHTVSYPNAVFRGKAKTCGCSRTISLRHMNMKHGDSGTRLHGIWKGVVNRCNPKNTHATHYGKRGIGLCDDWRDYTRFKEWAMSHGYSDELTIERRDVNGDYCPENCEWIPFVDQTKNTTRTMLVTHNNVTAPVSYWADKLGLKRPTVYTRITKGMSPVEALGLE